MGPSYHIIYCVFALNGFNFWKYGSSKKLIVTLWITFSVVEVNYTLHSNATSYHINLNTTERTGRVTIPFTVVFNKNYFGTEFFSSPRNSHLHNFISMAVVPYDSSDAGWFSLASGGYVIPADMSKSTKTAPIIRQLERSIRGPTLILHDTIYLNYFLREQEVNATYSFIARINALNNIKNVVEVTILNFFSGSVRIFTNSTYTF